VSNEHVCLRNLYKIQYLNQTGKKSELDLFFENVGVEMIKAETELDGVFYSCEHKQMEELLQKANHATHCKMKNMISYLNEIAEDEQQKETNRNESFEGQITEIISNLEKLQNDNSVFLLGGYKGLLHSIKTDAPSEIERKALYVDMDSQIMLPHGLVRILLN
jgi:23S rRNA pseudoU1915 N3-methylase RlmH